MISEDLKTENKNLKSLLRKLHLEFGKEVPIDIDDSVNLKIIRNKSK